MLRMFALAALMFVASVTAQAQEKLKVIATFSILGDVVKNVGGERVEVAMLVGPNADAHVYSPSPADGSCTEWVASNTTGNPIARIRLRLRMSTTRL